MGERLLRRFVAGHNTDDGALQVDLLDLPAVPVRTRPCTRPVLVSGPVREDDIAPAANALDGQRDGLVGHGGSLRPITRRAKDSDKTRTEQTASVPDMTIGFCRAVRAIMSRAG